MSSLSRGWKIKLCDPNLYCFAAANFRPCIHVKNLGNVKQQWEHHWLSLSLWALHVVRSEATRHRPATGLEKPGQLRRSAGTAVDSLSNTKSQSIWVNMGQLSNRISEKPVLANMSNHFPGLLSFAACLANSPPFSGTLDAGRIWETRPDLIKTYQNHSGNEQLLVISIWILRSWSCHWSLISHISLTFWIVRLFRFALSLLK